MLLDHRAELWNSLPRMSTNDDLPGGGSRSPARKKKKRPEGAPFVASATTRRAATATIEPHDDSKQWTTGQLAIALAVGLGVGGLGGYLAAPGGGTATAAKDQGSAQAQASQKGQQAPQPGAYVPLAPWTARDGAEQAKVTIVEFSDFQ
jgi:hypothetical protein